MATADGTVVERWTPVDSDSFTVVWLYIAFSRGVEAGVVLPGGR